MPNQSSACMWHMRRGNRGFVTWFKVDDSFHSHPKVLATPPAALGLWVVAGAWCGDNLTDGFVPNHVLPRLLPDAVTLAEMLVKSGLWRRKRGGFQFHKWLEWQPSKERVERERKAAAKRQADARERRKTSSSDQFSSRRDSHVSHGVSHTTPTRPPLKGEGRGAQAPPPSCPRHQGQLAKNCANCRSEKLGGLE